MRKIDLTAVITLHDEGVLVHKTMLSVFESLKLVKEAGYQYEIILHIDNGSEETRRYVERYKKRDEISIYENRFGDLGSSRNFAVEKAKGRYISFLDGDDLISSNWYLTSIRMLEESESEIVVHPEAILTFGIGQMNILTLQRDSFEEKNKDILVLLGGNRWGSVATAKKETFFKNPYHVLGQGYCYEDYIFNIETIEKNIGHRVAKKTILFYRRSDTSMLSVNSQNNATIPYMELFDFEKVKIIEDKDKPKADTKKSLKAAGYRIYKRIRNNNFANRLITPVAKVMLRLLERNPAGANGKKIPDFVLDEWVNINHIDSQLYPFKHLVDAVYIYSAEDQACVGEGYREISRKITHQTDYIFIVPWIVRGGADKVLLNYIQAMKEIHSDWHFTVISTLPSKNMWAKKMPDCVDHIDFSKYITELPPALADMLFTRVIIQLKCNRIHIINSDYGYEWARKHKSLLGNNFELTTSLFAWGYIFGSNMKGVCSYGNPQLFEIYDIVKKVFTDNKQVIDDTMAANGFNDNKFEVQYQPVNIQNKIAVKSGLCDEEKLQILWAGRVVSTKMPEVVAKIGKKLKSNITLHVYGEMDPDVDPHVFDNIESIQYHGAYDNFDSLPLEQMDLYLYTSLTDGMPNAILEAAAAGLPIIASNDGGVGEFIQNHETGILIEDKLDVDSYVEAINWAFKNISEMQEYAQAAQQLLAKRHSWKSFLRKIEKDFEI